jgi:predicted ATPase/energy-coupling factor transporter ATP-binding protein EcfA2
VARFGGFVAKLMGDGVLVYFGWPEAQEDEAERAVRAGLAITAAVGRLLAGGAPLAARVGIATGLVVVGDLVGEGAAQEEAVVGETPNLAARLQQLAEPGQVVVALATRRLLGDLFEVGELGARSVKGLAEPVPAFAVLGERTVESRFASRTGQTVAPMVGRDEELALLLRQWREAAAGEGRAVLVVGEAGIGKSRLAEALREAVLPERPTVLVYQGSPFHADSPLWPVARQLALAARFATADDAATRRAKLARIVSAAGRLDLLAALLDIAADPDPLAALDPGERRHRTLRALVDELLDLAARAPVLVLMEDVHWLDPSTIELVERTLDAIAGAPVLLILTARPEGQGRLGALPGVARLTLGRLGRGAVEAMVGRLVEARALTAEVRAEIVARTDGVPLFVEELTKAVLEAAPAGRGAGVPATLQDTLLARLDRDPRMKAVAQIAACIGRDFDPALLAAVADLEPTDLAAGLDALVAAELVRRRGGAEAACSFKHALVRDAAYESLLKSRSRQIHGRIADALAARFPARAQEQPELLARHLERARRHGEAARAWDGAGERALERAAMREAEAALQRAHELLLLEPASAARDCAEQAILGRLAVALANTRGPGSVEVERAQRRAAELAEALGDRIGRFRALWTLWRTTNVHADLDAALGLGEQLEREARAAGSDDLQLQAEHALWSTCLFRGDLARTCVHVERGLALYDPARHGADAMVYGGHDARECGLTQSANALFLLGFPDQALARNRAGLEHAERLGHPQILAHALNWSLLLLQVAGELDELGRRIDALARLAERHGLAIYRSEARILAAWLRLARDGDPAAATVMQGELDLRVAMGTAFAQTHLRMLIGEAWLRLGRPEAALAALEEGLQRAERTNERLSLPELLRLRAAALRALDRADRPAAEACLERAVAVARAQEARWWELRAARDLARLWAEQGERQRAQHLLAPVYARFTEGFDTPDLIEAKALLEEIG